MEFEERYFREELDYLRQLRKLLATEKPHLARFLAEKDAKPASTAKMHVRHCTRAVRKRLFAPGLSRA